MEPGYAFDGDRFRLGALCKREHDWRSTGQSLRRTCRRGGCVECEKFHVRERIASGKKKEDNRKQREKLRAQGLTSRGTVPTGRQGHPARLARAIRTAGRLPSVAALVMAEQRRYWAEHPAAKAKHARHWARVSWWLEYQTKPDLRLYHREKAKRRKMQDRGQTPVQIPVSAIRQRFNEFGNSCAYCGKGGDMEIEHVEPISSGGAHDIGNIVPACSRCNTSKRSHDMELWYQAQPFFSEIRLHRIRRVTRPPEGQQLALALA